MRTVTVHYKRADEGVVSIVDSHEVPSVNRQTYGTAKDRLQIVSRISEMLEGIGMRMVHGHSQAAGLAAQDVEVYQFWVSK